MLETSKKTPELSMNDSILRLATDDQVIAALDAADNRSELLPALFRVRGLPYSLQDYPQFRVFYARDYVSDLIIMSARQCGKSQNLSTSEVLDGIQIPHFQILYVAPLQSQTERYSHQVLLPALNSCELAKFLQATDMKLSDSNIIKAVFHQSFATGSGIQLGYAKTSADRLRGITVDRIDFDEVQDQIADNIPIIKESLTTSTWKVCRYTGTAKTLDNTIERIWQQSSRCEWGMKCSGCNYHNIPDDQEDCRCLRMVQADGLHCLKCGKKLNPREGEWIAHSPGKMNTFRGYHISQTILPANTENPMRWNKIIDKLSTLDITTIKNEVLGISSSTGVRIITPDDIKRNSVLPSRKEIAAKMLKKDPKFRYTYVFSGVDWGGAEQTSFTVHVIIGITRDGQIHVLYAKRYVGFDPDSRLADIARAHFHYGCDIMAADFGMGFDLNVMLIKRFGIKVIQMQFTSGQKKMMNWSPRQEYPCWCIDKLLALNSMFVAIKDNQYKFPGEEAFEVYTQDLLSPYEEVADRGGTERRQYTRDPALPDDFAMALCFASMAAYKAMYQDITALVPKGSYNPASSLTGAVSYDRDLDPREVLNSGT